MLPSYNNLSQAAIDKLKDANILNGCGPQSWKGKGPNWLFRACCYQHDYNYAKGGTEADRRWADWGFYSAMRKDIKRLPWWRQPFAKINAWIFYQGVRLFGKRHFATSTPTDLNNLIEIHGS